MATIAKGFSYTITSGKPVVKVIGLFTERELDTAIVAVRKQNELNRLNLKYNTKEIKSNDERK